MTPKRILLAIGLATALGLGASAPSVAQEPSTNSADQPHQWYNQWHMRPMMGLGQMDQGQLSTMWSCMMCHNRVPGSAGHNMGRATMQPLRQDLTAEDVKHMMEHRLAWHGNPNVKVGKVEEKDGDTIVAEIVTQDGSLVQSLEVDRHTGWMKPAK